MTRRTRIESALAPFLERMLEAREAVARDRALLEGMLELTGAQAASLWSRHSGRWHPHQSLGELACLPLPARVRALLEAPPEAAQAALRSSELVLRPPAGPWAVVVGGVPESRGEDLAEALLAVHAALAPTEGEAPGALPFADPREPS